MRAEVALFDKDPAGWLTKGPGRDRPGSPGWSLPVHAPDGKTAGNGSASDEVFRLLGIVHVALASHPEAREAVLLATTAHGVKDPVPKP